MKPFMCDYCGQPFDRKFNLSRHIINNHLNNRKHKIRISCPYCQSNFTSFKLLDVHQNEEHSRQIEVKEYVFKTEQEFCDWKEAEQISVQAQFFVHQSYPTKSGERVKQFLCSRSGTYKSSRSQPERKRPQSTKGSRKIGSICPARIIATFSSNMIKVKYYPNHRPHEKNLLHLSLPKSEEKILADKLKNGVSLKEVLNDIRNECVSSNDLQIKHFVKKKTLHNIRRKYKIPSTAAPKNKDETSVSELLNECNKKENNPFIIFKKPGDQHDLLNTDDMFIVIMTESQKEVLNLCCHEQICIDSVSNVEKYNYQLVVITVIDELGEAFPCAFCLTSQINDFTMSLFFNLVKTQADRNIETKLFTSDDDCCYYNAWQTVMTSVPSRFLNKWYVDKDFRQNLRTIASKKDKCEVYSNIHALHDEPDSKRFSYMLDIFLQNLRINEFHEFTDFFISTYYTRKENWAVCYRDPAFLNVTIMLEKFHKHATNLYLQFIKTQRLDKLLYQLLKTIRDKTFDRRIGLEEGHGNRYIEKINHRHKLAKQVKTIEKIDNNEWQVESVDAKGLKYQVKLERSSSDRCHCQMKCSTCNTCVHEFYCTCYDYLLSNYLCKHIHAVKMYKDSNQNDDLFFKVLTCEGLYETINIPNNSQSFENIATDINSAAVSYEEICDTVADDPQMWSDIFDTADSDPFMYIFNEDDNNSDFLCDTVNLPVITDALVDEFPPVIAADDAPANESPVVLNKMETICSILKTGVLNQIPLSDQMEINKCADEVLTLLCKDTPAQGFLLNDGADAGIVNSLL